MLKQLSIKLVCLLLAASPTMGLALDCATKTEELTKILPGNWIAANTFGTLTFGGRTMILPPGNTGSGEILAQSDGLVARDWGVPGVFPIQIAPEATLAYDAAKSLFLEHGESFSKSLPEFINHETMREAAACASGLFAPQFLIQGVFQDPEGQVDFKVYLFVINKNTMVGVMSGNLKSRSATAKRITQWARVN